MRTTPQIICEILQDALELDKEQIWVFNQRRAIPEDKNLYIVVGLISSKIYGSNSYYSNNENLPITETLEQFANEMISIDIFSYTNEAIQEYPRVIGALRSTISESAQELNALKIGAVPLSVNNVSEIDGPTLLNRMSITLQVMRKYSMILESDYYDRITPGYIALSER